MNSVPSWFFENCHVILLLITCDSVFSSNCTDILALVLPTLTHTHTHTHTHTLTVHCGSTRQTASITDMNQENLRTGDRATCHFHFIKNPEFLQAGTKMVLREGRTKAIGSVSKVSTVVEPLLYLPRDHLNMGGVFFSGLK